MACPRREVDQAFPMSATSISIDVWSDVVCPWCFIGKRRLEAGVKEYQQSANALEVDIVFHAFQLSPDMPLDFEGSAVDSLVRHKGIAPADAEQMQAHVIGVATTVGLDYDFGALKPANSLKAHQVLWLAKGKGIQLEMKERLLAAHFDEGRHIGRDAVLAELGASVGLDPDEVIGALADQRYLPSVRSDLDLAREIGISGVPFFVVDGRLGISGAQPSSVFAEVLRRVTDERRSP
jgi:predicted DsbA family dithiol-disulfide isomerase